MLLVPRRSRSAFFAALALLCTGSVLAGQGTKLNAPLARGAAGDVTESQISPDSRRVVYRADQDVDETFRLYGVPIEGGAVVPIGPAPVAGGDVQSFRISPSSRLVAYRADQDTDEVVELYSASIAGRQPGTRLNGALVPGGDVASFEIGSDSRRVVYLANQESVARLELFSVPVTGGAPVKLNGALVAGGNVGRYVISPDGKRVVYVADQRTDEVHELFGVPISGGTPVPLGPPLDSARWFEISPDSRRVVFTSGGLRSVSILGGDPVTLTSVPQFRLGFQITPDSRRVLFAAPGDRRLQLHSVLVDGGPAKKLSEHGESGLHQVVISPDSRRVAYTIQRGNDPYAVYTVPVEGGDVVPIMEWGNQVSLGPFSPDSRHILYNDLVFEQLFSAPAAGGPSIQLNDEPSFGGYVTRDSRTVVCVDDFLGAFYPGTNVYSIPLTGGVAVRLNESPAPDGGVGDVSLSPDGTRVVYRADQDSDEVVELYSVSVHGGPVTKLNAPLVLGGIAGDVGGHQVSPDGTRVVYRADQDVDQVYELYGVLLPGGAPTKLNGPLVCNGDVTDFVISPDSRRVVYAADQEVDGRTDLHSVPIDGGPAVRLSTKAVVGNDFDVSPDSSWVVFRDDVAFPAPPAVRVVPIDGGAPLELSASLPPGHVNNVQISPDSSRVVFQYLENTPAFQHEVYSVAITGGLPAKLNPTPVPGGHVLGARILPDSSAVFYMADLELDEVYELFIVPIAGGPSTKLNGPLAAGGDVSYGSQVSADSDHFVYMADQDTNDVFELFSVSLASHARVKLNPPLVAGGGVSQAAIAPDASRVVYLADQNANDVFELFSVPIEGGPATRLNAPLVAGGDVDTTSIWISPDSMRVAYFADQDTNNVIELYSVPIAGRPVAKISGELAPGGDVLPAYASLQFDPLLRRVLFLADRAGNDVYELYVAPLAGGTQPAVLNAPLAPGRDVTGSPYYTPFSLARGAAVYRADQDEDEVFELYLSALPVPGHTSAHR